ILKIKYIGGIFWEAIDLNDEIHKISHNLLFLEKYPFSKNGLIAELLNPIRKSTYKPSVILKRLLLLISLLGFSSNIIIKILLNVVLPFDYILIRIFLNNKEKIKKQIPAWLDCWYELESLSAMANFAWLNPEYVFPEFNTKKSFMNSRQLGHPLIKKDAKKTNDFQLDKIGHIILITGSNMSGKSTFLRTIGINLCLAQAGGVVDAQELTLQFMRIFTCIKIDDNLAEGLSYFYAEVKRLKQMLIELATVNEYPLFYLIDEIYKGTNNQERLAGSRALIKSLSNKFGSGVISTHDLELTSLESELKSVQNFHFQEHIENRKMVFDFKLRQGPCPTTNALVIMKNEGLPT
ncbi:MAG TPA: DNA mismatch repair protein MutS, partial [Caldithrix sp.]|nr:DNA mismatch repair protein MutS [Caldithrix sp.]